MCPLWTTRHLRMYVSLSKWSGYQNYVIIIILAICLSSRKVLTDGLDGKYRHRNPSPTDGRKSSPVSLRGRRLGLTSGPGCHSPNLVSWLVGGLGQRYRKVPSTGLHNLTPFTGTAPITATDLVVVPVRLPFLYTTHINVCSITGTGIHPVAAEMGCTPSTLHWCRDQDLVNEACVYKRVLSVMPLLKTYEHHNG